MNSGSPPLARRAPVHLLSDQRPRRFTSARAESTLAKLTPTARGTVHLRSRGEHETGRLRKYRGTVHLRSRGEHRRAALSSASAAGSPPLARRAPLNRTGPISLRRFTSARAESTRSTCGPGPAAAVHLRSRGEHDSLDGTKAIGSGSPPLARRAQDPPQSAAPGRRFTSARAESTPSARGPARQVAVHLRSRGEHGTPRRRSRAVLGSPPLARRALVRAAPVPFCGRFTSARAESTLRDQALSDRFAGSLLSFAVHRSRFVVVAQRV